jgi:hypothetical protein
LSGSTYTWTGVSSTDWNTAANWDIGAAVATTVPNSTTATAIDDIATASAIISNGATDFVDNLNVGGTGHVIVGGGPAIGGGGGGTLVATSGIAVTSTNAGGGLVGGPATSISAPTLTVGAGAIIGGGGTFNITNLVNSGIIQADGQEFALGPLNVTGGNITGTGSIEVDGPSTFELGSTTAQSILVAVASTETATVILDNPATFTGTLDLFNPGTHLNLFLKGEAPTGASYDAETHSLVITNATGTIDTIAFGSNGTVFFAATPNSSMAGYGEISITPAPAGSGLTVTNTTTGQPVAATGTSYTGPVAGIQSEYVSVTPDNLNISTSTPNWFIHSGSGTDAIDVSKGGGTNVLDGSTGSNFLTGGTGNDTFFLDDRSPAADVFSTVVGFHSGDNATVFGVNPSDFVVNTLDNQGAAGFTGLDFAFSAAGHANANIVLAGYTTADLSNGRLTTSYGTTADTAGVAGSQYLLIHAN